MELSPDNLHGMAPDAAKEYIAAHVATKLLNEKKLAELDAAAAKWTERARLAREKGVADLAEAAEAERARVLSERGALAAETEALAASIETMRRQLPGLAARQRSVDPDLLEQELVIAAGGTPGDEAADTARKIGELEKGAAADEALAALKARLAGGPEGA